MRASIEDRIVQSKVLDDEFKWLCYEFCQVLVDAGSQGLLDLAPDHSEVISKILQVWFDHRKKDDPPINLWSAMMTGVVPSDLILKMARLADQQTPARKFLQCMDASKQKEQLTKEQEKDLELLVTANEGKLRITLLIFEFKDRHPTMMLFGADLLKLARRPDANLKLFDLTPDQIPHPSGGICNRLITELGSRYRRSKLAEPWESVSSEIRKDKTAILIAVGYFQHGAERLREVCRSKPAPLIAQMLSHQGATGSASIDWFVCDSEACSDNVATEWFGSGEKILCLPKGTAMMPGTGIRDLHKDYEPVNNPTRMAAVRMREGLPTEGILFGTFNDYDRLSPEFFNFCISIVSEVRSKWVLISRGKVPDRRLQARAEQISGCKDMLIFVEFIDDQPRLFDLMGAIDLHFDPWKYNGHTMTIQLLWAGGVVVTLKGSAVHSRMCASLLAVHGQSECIFENVDSLRSYVLQLVISKESIWKRKESFLQSRLISPVFKDGFSSLVFAALKKVWKQFCENRHASQREHVYVSKSDLQMCKEHKNLMSCAENCLQMLQNQAEESACALVAHMEEQGVFEDSEAESLLLEDAIAILTCVQQTLGYSGLRYHSVDSEFLYLNATYQFKDVLLRVTKKASAVTTNRAIPKDNPAVRHAFFLLKCAPPSTSIEALGRRRHFCERPVAAWDKASPVDVQEWTICGRRFYAVATVQCKGGVSMAEVLRNLKEEVAGRPSNPPLEKGVDML